MKPNSRRLATAAVFAALYAVLSLIPVSRLVGNVSFLTMGEVFSPLAGIVLGPLEGGFSVFIGTFAAIALGKTVGFDGFDFIPGVVGAVTAGLAMKGRVGAAAGLSILLFAIYMLDPLSAPFIYVASVPVPFLWMHMLSTGLFVALSLGMRKRANFASQAALIASVVFLSTMTAHVAGAIMYENVLVRINQLSVTTVKGSWQIVFYVYPIERAFFTVVGSILAIGVLRALPQKTLSLLRGED